MDELEFRSMKKYYEAYGYKVIEIRKITDDISEYMATNRWDCLNHRFYENKKEHLFLGVPEDKVEWVIKYNEVLVSYKKYLEKEELKKCTNNQVIKKDADLVAKHKEICEKLNKIYEKKNHDYGDSFGETYNELGIISCITRMNDKMNRLKTLVKTDNQVKDESVSDTLLDLANYAIMTYMCLHQQDNGKES